MMLMQWMVSLVLWWRYHVEALNPWAEVAEAGVAQVAEAEVAQVAEAGVAQIEETEVAVKGDFAASDILYI
jgi:hypothetical protein